jgi:hypothetical protein
MYNADMNFTARWTIKETDTGISVVYENLVRGITFDCGICRKDTLPELLWEFIVSEGDPGDVVYWGDTPPFQVSMRAAA